MSNTETADSLDRAGPSDLVIKRYPAVDLVGRRYGRLLVTEYLGFSKSSWCSHWKCRCDCGWVVSVPGKALTRSDGATRSCGCIAAELSAQRAWKGHGELSRHYFHHVRLRAQRDDIVFNLTIEDAWDLFVTQDRRCALSGVEINFGRYRPAATDRRRGDWPRLNTASLDRVDSGDGYVLGNVQWVHKELNRMKGALSANEFVALCTSVVEHANQHKEDA
jgi:hypothetical protein